MPHKTDDKLYILASQPSQNISDRLFMRMRSLIISGELPPGYAFPNETVLCERLGVGRSSLREAYKALATAGYITRNKSGTYVNSREDVICATPFGITMEKSDLREIMEFRMMFEQENARYAALRATPEEVESLRLAHEEYCTHSDNVNQLVQADLNFHLRLAVSTHNELLAQTMYHMLSTLERGGMVAFTKATTDRPELMQAFHSQHEEILGAIERRNPGEASRRMGEHVTLVGEILSIDGLGRKAQGVI